MLIKGDALEVLKTLQSDSVNCMVTSPPYYGLRDYGVAGQIGLEKSSNEFIEKLIDVFTEAKRVLRLDGTLWVNISDSYAGSGKGGAKYPENARNYKQGSNRGAIGKPAVNNIGFDDYQPKELMCIPFRFAIAMHKAGWILRQDIIWNKPNPMPESVKDRCTKAHEYIFLFTQSRNYYFNSKAIQEVCVGFNQEAVAGSNGVLGQKQSRRRKGNNKSFRGGGVYTKKQSFDNSASIENQTQGNVKNKEGLRNKRSVWTVAIGGVNCKEDGELEKHYATFPPELIIPCVRAGCPKGGTVLDMFSGSGTTGEVALQEGCNFIGIDLNPKYTKIAQRRIDSVPLTFENINILGG